MAGGGGQTWQFLYSAVSSVHQSLPLLDQSSAVAAYASVYLEPLSIFGQSFIHCCQSYRLAAVPPPLSACQATKTENKALYHQDSALAHAVPHSSCASPAVCTQG